MLVLENKLKGGINDKNNCFNILQEENEFIKKFLGSIEAELLATQNVPNFLEISNNIGIFRFFM